MKDTENMNDVKATIEDLAARMAPVTVAVRLPDGSTEMQVLEVHPLAMVIPGMNEEDDRRLRADVKARGVREPLTLLDGKVLDGRNRLRIAGQEGATVRLKEFTGSEADARAYVWSVNVARRHLSTPQLALIADRFGFISEAKETAGDRWPGVVSRQIGGAVTPKTLERFSLGRVTDAPATVARIDSGQIRRVDVAVKSAASELGITVPPTVARSAWDRLGCARGDVLAAERAVLAGEPLDAVAFAGRAREIQALLVSIDKTLRMTAQDEARSRMRVV
jgi:hypothetical protein